MTNHPSMIELYRHALLRQLASALPASLSAETLQLGLAAAGFESSPEAMHKELIYLGQKNFIENLVRPLSPMPRYRLTAEGRDYLMREGLE